MWRTVILIILVLAATLPVQAESKKTKGSTFSQKESRESFNLERRAAFSPAERNLIRTVLLDRNRTLSQQHSRNLPYGLQKKIARGRSLPPGWQKKVAPGHSLNYHVYRQGESLPDFLLHRLAPPPVGSEILRIENKIIRLNAATRTILDVFDLIPRD
jgi:Ni/Co efflux regulator RcnB